MMEEKRSFLRVGLLLVGGAGLLIGLIWFLGGSEIRNGVLFESYYKESVRGLDVGGVVRYRGAEFEQLPGGGFGGVDWSDDGGGVRAGQRGCALHCGPAGAPGVGAPGLNCDRARAARLRVG